MSGKDEDCECYVKARNPEACPQVKRVTHPLRYYEFTQEEIKVLEECDKESFYQRCIPFSTLFAGITYAAIKYGYLKKHPQFGVYPKLIVAAFLGHVWGRLSYLPHCDAKIREDLPANSHLAKVMRKYYKDRCEAAFAANDPKKKKKQ